MSVTRAEEAPEGLSPADVATIIETLGGSIVEAYGAVASDADTTKAASGWGSKQREQLLRALIERVAVHARSLRNAALSATDVAVATFARNEFKKRDGTRSARDRAPITKNIDKVVGGWLRRLGRRVRQNAVTASMTGNVELSTGPRRFRLTLTFAYPWRLIADRRLRITTQVDEITGPGEMRRVPFRADPDAATVALPEDRRRYRPEEAEAVRLHFLSLKATAEAFRDPELAAYADAGLRTFVPLSVAKVFVAVVLTAVVSGALASPPARRFYARVYDAITSSGSMRELLEKLTVDPKEGVFVTPSGAQSQVARSGSGSEVRVSPGASPELLYIQTILSGKDLSELSEQMVPLGDMTRVGINAVQYRTAPGAPIVPWLVEIVVIPEQDKGLAAELARESAAVSLSYNPPLPTPEKWRVQNLGMPQQRVSLVSELREIPHTAATYTITATVSRETRRPQHYKAVLMVDESGFMILRRERGAPLTAVRQDLKVGHPICTTILHPQSLPMPFFDQRDYVWATAKLFEEQDVVLLIYPPSSLKARTAEATVDWGDGARADFQPEKGVTVVSARHSYRVGERTYPITIYFQGLDVVYQFDLYVFGTRGSVRRTSVVDYVTPYPPNPDLTSLAEEGWRERQPFFLIPGNAVPTDSITLSRQGARPVLKAPMPKAKAVESTEVRYLWRPGSVIDIPPAKATIGLP